jgi:single-strand DNA-binding protein
MDINKAIIVGRLTRDPESRSTPNGINVTSFSVATNFVYKNHEGQKVEQVEYHNIVAWRKLAEIAAAYLKRGRRVLIEGRLQTRNWEGNDGAKRNRTEIVADNLIMLDSANASGGSRVESGSEEPVVEPVSESKPASKGDEEISVEDIPF